MLLKEKQRITGQIGGGTYTVVKKLGEGGQGAVYLVRSLLPTKGSYSTTHLDENYAVKWYNDEQSTDAQYKTISDLIMRGAPKQAGGERFVWPKDIVKADGINGFGYLMRLIDMKQFAEIGEIWARKKPDLRMRERCVASYRIAQSYAALHLSGYCYRDISRGNVILRPSDGEVLICDNDNVGVNNEGVAQVKGTIEYMAPEVILGQKQPSAQSDLHSLAVLLFQIWIKHHPFHGMQEYSVRCWDLPAKKLVYGDNAVFIFDPHNTSNRLPDDPDYDTPRRAWQHCPDPLRQLFIKAFAKGSKNPSERVGVVEWQRAFLELRDNILLCPHDNAEILCMPSDTKPPICWYCKRTLQKPVHLMLTRAAGNSSCVLMPDGYIYASAVNAHTADVDKPYAQVVRHPTQPGVWGLKNLSDEPWQFAHTDGSTHDVPAGRSAPIVSGGVIQFGGGKTGTFK